mmetsp:Transcript_40941/g.73817  ORF Transcript_40941/g.73817 Transcript_40941/m.73817 type:complete len:98 (-) Transcript_40941:381-674(-)
MMSTKDSSIILRCVKDLIVLDMNSSTSTSITLMLFLKNGFIVNLQNNMPCMELLFFSSLQRNFQDGKSTNLSNVYRCQHQAVHASLVCPYFLSSMHT